MKRLAVIAILAAAPFLAGTAETPKTEGLTTKGPEAKAIEWLPAPGPAETAGPADDLKTVQGLTVHEWGTSCWGPRGFPRLKTPGATITRRAEPDRRLCR